MNDKTYLQNPSYSALLSLNNGDSTGSGFSFRYEDDFYLVTAKHVLYTRQGVLRCEVLNATFQNLKGGQQEAVIWEIDMTIARCFPSENADVAIIHVGKQGENAVTFEEYVNKVKDGGFEPIHLDVAKSSMLEDVGIANTVFLMGYPTSLLFTDISTSIPLFRKGIIAGFDLASNIFVVDCPAYYGNSGSPIIEECEDGELRFCGVASRYIPFVTEWRNPREPTISNTEYFNSGYSICTPVNEIINLIQLTQQNG